MARPPEKSGAAAGGEAFFPALRSRDLAGLYLILPPLPAASGVPLGQKQAQLAQGVHALAAVVVIGVHEHQIRGFLEGV